MLLRNISSLITVLIFTYICVLLYSSLVSFGPQKYSLVKYSSNFGLTHNPVLYIHVTVHRNRFLFK